MNFRSLACLALAGLCACPAKDDPTTTTDEATQTSADTTSQPTSAGPTDTSDGTTVETMDGPTSAPGTDTTADTTTGGNEPDVCACIDDEAHFDTYTCPAGPCGAVTIDCDVELGEETPGCEGIGGVFTIDEMALGCSLDRLIAGDEGAVSFVITSNGPGSGGGVAHILPERQAMVRFWQFYDLGGSDTNAGIIALKDAAYFEDCKTKLDLAERYACFRAWNASEPPATCDEASSYEDL